MKLQVNPKPQTLNPTRLLRGLPTQLLAGALEVSLPGEAFFFRGF